MCGIAGAVSAIPGRGQATGRTPSPTLLRAVERMSEAERHRGPDGSGSWHSDGGEVVFAHRRLAIIDLSEAGAQPMIDAETGCVVTFNGEIYNYLEIRALLEKDGETFRSSSDTEVILKAYKRWGIDSVRRFRGIFALALWDPRRREVHLVRDPLGIKPLYWTAVQDPDGGGETVLFASEIRALAASGRLSRRLDPAAVASYLWHGFVVGPHTILEDVHLLPAASALTIGPAAEGSRRNERRLHAYWRLPSSGAAAATTVEELRDELRHAIRLQLIADVPLGVFLSGGIDSSAVAAVASEIMPGALRTFTIGFDDASLDESRYARQVAEAVGSRHTEVELTEETFRDQLEGAFAAVDQPTFDALNTYFVSRAAREAGMTVALAGTGGDELFGGYRSYVEIPRALRMGAWLPNGTHGLLGRAFDAGVASSGRALSGLSWGLLHRAPPQTRWGKLADVVRASHDPLGLYQVSYALFTRDTQRALADGRVRAAQPALDYGLPSAVAADWRQRIAGSEGRHAVSLLELSSFVGERLLRDTDSASMAVALEVRVPLLDHVLAEKVAGLDPARRFTPARKKQVLRDMALGRLDPAIFDRPKAGFVLPIQTWARRGLQGRMEDVLTDPGLARSAGLRPEPLRMLWRSFVEGRRGLYWTRLWGLFVLLWWCRTHDVRLAS
jgi:asparagine synthase (glutamine-hydrolysing)